MVDGGVDGCIDSVKDAGKIVWVSGMSGTDMPVECVMTNVTRQKAITAAVIFKSSRGVLDKGLACSRSHGGVFCLLRLRDLSEWECVRANVRLKSSPDPISPGFPYNKGVILRKRILLWKDVLRGVFLRYNPTKTTSRGSKLSLIHI